MDRYVERDFEMKEKEEEKTMDVIVKMEQLKKEQSKKIIEEDDKELADIIYIFVSPDKPGIKFYSRSPKSALHFGTFETDKKSISKAKWDDNVNAQEGATLFRVREGRVAVKTYIVSVEQMAKIVDSIVKQKDSDKIIINIAEDKLVSKKGSIGLNNSKSYDSKYFKEYNEIPYDSTDGIGGNNFKK